MPKTRGIVAAVAAYTSWGLLAPVGKMLLETSGPFTLNTLRTAGALIAFFALYGPRRFVRAVALLGRDRRLWYLGVAGLGFTFGAYLLSVVYLQPTIAALTIYLAPILISWGARVRLGERASPWAIPTIFLTLVGGAIAVLEPGRGVPVPRSEAWGLLLGLLGVFGWTFYTLYLKQLSAVHDDATLTIGAFVTSGVAFVVVAAVWERFEFVATPRTMGLLGLYIVFPSVLSFALYAYAVRHAGASLTGVLLGIELAATAVFSYFLTNEPFHSQKIIGIGIVLAAVTGFLVAEALTGRAPGPGENAQHDQQG